MSDLIFADSLSRLGTESAFVVLARAQKLASEGRDIINLGIGQPDFKTPGHIVEAGIKALRDADPWVRSNVAGALWKLGEKARPAEAPLREALADSSARVTLDETCRLSTCAHPHRKREWRRCR